MIEVGSPAPDFTIRSNNGDIVRLSDFRGKKNVVIYFYPRDFSRGCTAEACSFRDSYEEFRELGAEVIGISGQNQESHQAFAGEHRLPFILLSDQDGSIRKAYGVRKSLGIIPGRTSFVIDKQGIVRHVFVSQTRATAHADKALAVLKSLS